MPATAAVEKTPLLIVPPCINKYYLLDLRYRAAPGNQKHLMALRNGIFDK